MHILLLDNYDSFTFNLFHYLRDFCPSITVKRNNEISLEETDNFTHIVLSPGPGLPKDAGILMDVIKRHAGEKPILGICLGMQAIAEFYGAELYNLPEVMHGRIVPIRTEKNSPLFTHLPQQFAVGLYHSWAVNKSTLPPFLQATAHTEQGVVMALEHQIQPMAGVQFHPESILTENGKEIIANWLRENSINSSLKETIK